MSTFNFDVAMGKSVTLATAGKYCDRDIVVNAIAPLGYVNQIPISTDTDGSIYNGIGYRPDYRLNSSGAVTAGTGYYLSGFIPCNVGDIVRMKNVTFLNATVNGITAGNQRICFYDANFNPILNNSGAVLVVNGAGIVGMADGVLGSDGNAIQWTVKGGMTTNMSNVAYFRIGCPYIGEDSIITVNQEIKEAEITALETCTVRLEIGGGYSDIFYTTYSDGAYTHRYFADSNDSPVVHNLNDVVVNSNIIVLCNSAAPNINFSGAIALHDHAITNSDGLLSGIPVYYTMFSATSAGGGFISILGEGNYE